jgi:hypothetical protein
VGELVNFSRYDPAVGEIEQLGCDQHLGQIGLRVAEGFFNVFHVGSLAARRNVRACRLSDLCFAANFLRAAAGRGSEQLLKIKVPR